VTPQRLPQRQVGDARVLVAAAGEHGRPVGGGEGGQLGPEPGLADPGLAGHQHGPALPGRGLGEGRAQPAQLRPAAHEGPGDRGGGRPRRAGGSGRGGHGQGLGVEQLQVGRLQLRRGADPQLLGQRPPVAVVDAQRLATVAGGGVRPQEPLVGRVPERLQGDQVPGRADGRLAVPGGQVDVGLHLQAVDEHLAEGGAPILDPGALVAGEQRPPGDGPGPPGGGQGPRQVAGLQRRPGQVGLAGGQLHVDRGVGGQGQPVAAGHAGEGAGGRQAELVQEVPDLADHPAEGGPPGGWEPPAPERVGQLLAGHRPVALGHQVGEDQRGLPPGQVRGVGSGAVGLGRQLAGEGDLQRHGLLYRCVSLAAPSYSFRACQ
jgi:hypothetical protein